MIFKEEHNKHCAEIAERLHELATGNLYYCTECGDFVEADKDGACSACGNEWIDDGVSAYLDENFGIDVMLDLFTAQRNGVSDALKGARILVAFGGPNVYIDTMGRGEVSLKWWSECGSAPMTQEAIDAVNEYVISISEC